MIKTIKHTIFSLIFALSILITNTSFATTLNVDINDPSCDNSTGLPYCSIQSATSSATSGDTIEIASGTYFENIAGYSSLTYIGENKETTIVDGSASNHVFGFGSSSSLTIEIRNLTIQNGSETNGGGIFMQNIDLTLINVAISNNMASEKGGGIYLSGGSLTLTNSSILDNIVTAGPGGGIYQISGNTTITNSQINYNEASLHAGGIHHDVGILQLQDSQVSHNTSAEAGGIYKIGGEFHIVRSSINHNEATTTNTGGIFSIGSLFTITDSDISYNASAGGVGGIYNIGANFTLTNSLVSFNEAQNFAGGILVEGSSFIVTNSTISSNTAGGHAGGLLSNAITNIYNTTIVNNVADNNDSGNGDGGGIFVGPGTTISNSIIANNVDKGNEAPDCIGALSSTGYTLLGEDTGCTFTTSTGDQIGTLTSPINPLLEDLADNNGPTMTHALQLSSPALDAGNPAGCLDHSATALTTDGRGFLRPQDGNGDDSAICDLGAFEFGICGDGFVDTGEECDDGNGLNSDNCTNQCLKAVCGDGFTENSVEECDDGNLSNGDGCDSSCEIEVTESEEDTDTDTDTDKDDEIEGVETGSSSKDDTDAGSGTANEADSSSSTSAGCSLVKNTQKHHTAHSIMLLAVFLCLTFIYRQRFSNKLN